MNDSVLLCWYRTNDSWHFCLVAVLMWKCQSLVAIRLIKNKTKSLCDFQFVFKFRNFLFVDNVISTLMNLFDNNHNIWGKKPKILCKQQRDYNNKSKRFNCFLFCSKHHSVAKPDFSIVIVMM